MNQIWKETIVDCPIHGRRIKKIPIYQQNPSFNTKNYSYKNMNNYYSFETEPNYNKNDLSFDNKNNSNSRHFGNNITSHQNIINTNYESNISLSNAYKSSLNNPVKIYENGYEYKNKDNAISSRNKPIYIKNIANESNLNDNSKEKKFSSYKRNIIEYNSNDKYKNSNNNAKKGGAAIYRRRNEINSFNNEQNKKDSNKIYNRTRENNYSYDINSKNKLDKVYINQTLDNSNHAPNYNKDINENEKLNNGVRKYSSKTNDVINQRIIVTEPKLNEEINNNSFIVNSTDLNNYKFYISRDNNLDDDNRILYNTNTQSIPQINRGYIKRNPYLKNSNTEYYNDNYNSNAYDEINKYMNKKTNEQLNINNSNKNSKKRIIEYEKPSSYSSYNNIYQEDINSLPIKKKKDIIYKNQNNNGLNENNINSNKNKKKILKYKMHELKQLRQNQFKIENSYINDEGNDENVEEHVEKYFDKNGNCIGGKKIIIKQEYDNGQKIIKKFVEEKYKSNSDYEILKKQEEYNYKNAVKKETFVKSTIKSSNNDTLDINKEEDNNINTIVTFGGNSKNYNLEEELGNNNEEKEADEQKIEINFDFEEDEEKSEENNDIDEDKFANENNISINIDEQESEKLAKKEFNDNKDIEEINKENGGINNEIKDEKENNLINKNAEKISENII